MELNERQHRKNNIDSKTLWNFTSPMTRFNDTVLLSKQTKSKQIITEG